MHTSNVIIISLKRYNYYIFSQHNIPVHASTADQRGISIDADVALWLDKLEVDGRPQLSQFQNFVLLTKEQHNELDDFKDSACSS